MTKERWKPIKDFEGLYKVSNSGRVLKWNGFYWVKKRHTLNNFGYCRITLCGNGRIKNILISRLVAIHFKKNPNNLPEVNHKDGNKLNNWDWNLEWCTHQYNVMHSYKMGLHDKNQNYKTKNIDKERVIRYYYIDGMSQEDLGIEFGVNRRVISRIVNHDKNVKNH